VRTVAVLVRIVAILMRIVMVLTRTEDIKRRFVRAVSGILPGKSRQTSCLIREATNPRGGIPPVS
jgi:hypothetical protein